LGFYSHFVNDSVHAVCIRGVQAEGLGVHRGGIREISAWSLLLTITGTVHGWSLTVAHVLMVVGMWTQVQGWVVNPISIQQMSSLH